MFAPGRIIYAPQGDGREVARVILVCANTDNNGTIEERPYYFTEIGYKIMLTEDWVKMCENVKQDKGYLLEIGEKALMLGGNTFYLASGEMHYFRFFKDGWKRRLKLMKDFGLTAVQTYVPWNPS